jgi:hypothetical protein
MFYILKNITARIVPDLIVLPGWPKAARPLNPTDCKGDNLLDHFRTILVAGK